MRDPYQVLGVPSTATDDEVKKAYRDLARKYHPDNYHDNPLADLAQERMKEINEAYEEVQSQRKAARQGGGYGGSYGGAGYGNAGYGTGASRLQRVRAAITQGNLNLAEELLNAQTDHDAEWNYLKGAICTRRGWLDEARRYYTNIVGKYGPHIQLLLKKAGGVLDQIKYICPLHGPVWRKDLGWFIEKYDTWSRYAPETKGVLIVYASMYGNTENAAQALAASLCDKGMSKVAMYDVSSTHVSQLISEAFKYSHIVLASVTYNLGIYPAMHDFLMDMKALNLQNRTFAIIENGSWAVKSGDLMQKFVNDELKNMTVLNERLSLASSMGTDKRTELEALADAILESMK